MVFYEDVQRFLAAILRHFRSICTPPEKPSSALCPAKADQKKWRTPISIVDFTPKRLSVPDMPVPGRM